MAVQLSTSRSLTSYFNDKETGGSYWEFFDEITQKFLTVKDLVSFFSTCKDIATHSQTESFKNFFIQSRCNTEALTKLVSDILLVKQRRVDLLQRIMQALPIPAQQFLKSNFRFYPSSKEQYNSLSEDQQDLLSTIAHDENYREYNKKWRVFLISEIDQEDHEEAPALDINDDPAAQEIDAIQEPVDLVADVELDADDAAPIVEEDQARQNPCRRALGWLANFLPR
ncbi:MAG TPA: hypothetical protein VLG44_08905 [Chlamydiales bacterium]|nr:hypothetical protein [Chlamydiales bacterium]